MRKKKAIVVGAGIAGLSAAAYLAKAGMEVVVLEKNGSPGGRARQFKADGFTFDMGPSWYWMPDVFEKFYREFGHTTSDFYELKRLSPSYRVISQTGEAVDIPSDMNELENLFEKFETGSAQKLRKFLQEAEYKYEVGMQDLVYKPSLSIMEYIDLRLLKGLLKMDVLSNIRRHVRASFKHPFLQELLEFPVLFLGALPQNTPALYSLMNYADLKLGTWYPLGGMYKIVEAFYRVAEEQGVKILLNHEVISIESENAEVKRVICQNEIFEADVVVSAGDYHHTEQHLLKEQDRVYSAAYWESRKLAPSCLLYYVGLNKKLKNVLHHNLFFDTDFNRHSKEIYSTPAWPENPLFYVSAPSVTDSTVAPDACENLFFLIPIAPGLTGDSEEIRAHYFQLMVDRLEKFSGESVMPHVVYHKSYSVRDFQNDYHAFKGNAYGLANTLDQTAILKPAMKSRKLKNLYFAGQLTVPGPGVPPAIISGKVAATQVIKDHLSV